MMNKKAFLSPKLYKKVDQKPTRHGYGDALVVAGKKNKNVVALCADLTVSTRTHLFKEAFPERFVEIGVAEQLLVTVAAGMAAAGKIPFTASYAAFQPGRCWEQIRTTASLNDLPIKVMGMHAGISVGPDGATHQALEELATMRSIPNMTVIAPADYWDAYKAVLAAAESPGPVYIRFGRENVPIISTKKTPFTIGKAEILREGKDVTVVACGSLVYEALIAAKELEGKIDVQVINNHTIKPIDTKTLAAAAKKTGAFVTAEEAQKHGGMGSAVMEVLALNSPIPVEQVAVNDRFGESGNPEELMTKFGLKSKDIVAAIKRVVKRKNGKA